ncbi:OLC1v1008116C1 [Oldenlandia corymbosa var. corymbosa]|uniref:OLC1v1008116C1 n=1 Tax=Oldenlandia corymbosa var. corymbosa TaxID=529605 RepID=A0AAV1DL22_OLDCO|nr:OLC1v1008116C1 [Oldenlandia corymbosa var. corymbosa]
MMAHSLSPAVIPSSSARSKLTNNSYYESQLRLGRVCACLQVPHEAPHISIANRRSVALGLVGIVVGVNLGDKSNANAAGKRPPPPPPKEKKDPNVTGLAAKLLASKKRKEAMMEEVARLREKGKTIVPPPSE